MLELYGGSITKALMDIYPDIGLDVSKFSHVPSMIPSSVTH